MNVDLLAGLDIVGDQDAGHESEPRVLEGHELRVGHERVVRLVSVGSPERRKVKGLVRSPSSTISIALYYLARL